MRSASKWIERCLWTIGFLTLAAWLAVWIGAKMHQAQGERELDRRLSDTPADSVPAPANSPTQPSAPKITKGDVIGRIDIPRLNLSTVIFEGTDADVLRDGVGHLTGSPLPGERGNVVLAAHRDTFFRPLRYVRNHDTIDVVTPSGTRSYQVFSTTIVTPDQTEVLAPAPGAVLTLITCYPFDWFGHAPKRFIVKARALDDHPSVSAAPPAKPASAQVADVMETVDDPAPPPPPKPTPIHHALPHKFKPYVPIAAARPSAAKPAGIKPDTPLSRSTPAPLRPTPKAEPIPQADTEFAESGPPDQPAGNRIIRGLKRLNPKGLFSKITGN